MSLVQPVPEVAPEGRPTTPHGLPAPPPPAPECRPRPSLSQTPNLGPAHPTKHRCPQGEQQCFFTSDVSVAGMADGLAADGMAGSCVSWWKGAVAGWCVS